MILQARGDVYQRLDKDWDALGHQIAGNSSNGGGLQGNPPKHTPEDSGLGNIVICPDISFTYTFG